MKKAMFYKQLENSQVRCDLCPHYCKLEDGEIGICGVRQNRDGQLYSLVYGRTIAAHVDPIEKKPLFHVAPGSLSFSMATVGCNFKCIFCQNSDISQVSGVKEVNRFGQELQPEQIVRLAKSKKCKSIAYTYTEPTIFYEYAYDTCKIAKKEGLLNVFISNGYINETPLREISPYLDAANIDLKSFRDPFYRELIGGKLKPVLETLKLMKKLDIWVEVTTLIIPGNNDSDEELRDIARFISSDLGPETPWHISRFYPQYHMTDGVATDAKHLQHAWDIGKEAGLRYVYVGNLPGDRAESTYCYSCGARLIEREGYRVLINRIADYRCPDCGAEIAGSGL